MIGLPVIRLTDEQMIEWLGHFANISDPLPEKRLREIAIRLRELAADNARRSELLREAVVLIHDRNGSCVDLQGENGKCDCCACENAAAWLARVRNALSGKKE